MQEVISVIRGKSPHYFRFGAISFFLKTLSSLLSFGQRKMNLKKKKDTTATGGGNEDVTLGSSLLHGDNLVSLHAGLESVDGVDLSDEDTGTHSLESLGTSLADISVSSNNSNLRKMCVSRRRNNICV